MYLYIYIYIYIYIYMNIVNFLNVVIEISDQRHGRLA